jgi:UDP-N-acetylmuramoyl-L-alanyl-D-glutamate--2,6-diaminopimelate ligase
MANNLEDLFKNLQDYKGITDDSREAKPGFIFVAVKGLGSDGHDYIPQAVKNGATAVVGERDLTGSVANYIKIPDSRDTLGELASEFYGRPSEKLKVIGVTGTKGKTTTCHIIHHILTTLGKKAGLLSSISVPGLHVTSPDVIFLHKSLKEFVDKGYEYAIIEVSSHGIDQKRIAGVKFDLAVLTNIAPEHLDYHKTFEEYKRVKMSFIESAKDKVIAPKDTDINVLPGKFNNLNVEAAIMAVEKFGIKRNDAISAVKSFKLPFGRLTEVPNDLGIRIFIDFAHTPDSLEAALTYLKSETKGKLISVFGCAGERDKSKRFKMGKVSAELADFSVLTAEDPRSENIFDILSEMVKGAVSAGGIEGKNYIRIPLRGEAIVAAIGRAKKGDIVGIFGKGHEESMAYKGFEHPWSDLETVNNYLNREASVSAIILAAGKGSRMKSELPKILHEICGRPMISYSLQNLRQAEVGEIVAVVSYEKDMVLKEIGGAVKIAVQENPKGGTADSLAAGLPEVSDNANTVIVIYGDDTAFYTPETIKKVIRTHSESGVKLTFVTLIKDNPYGLGRILRDASGNLIGIIEEKDATEEQRKIKEVNIGMYVFDKTWLAKNLPDVQKSPITGEYYIPELIKIAIGQKQKVSVYRLPDSAEWQGINTPEELKDAEVKMEKRLKKING